ncbi:MAG: SDR family oxidoreductase [Dehalococcoidia bacterium]|jgi:3-oxoacyl-[acyl-carrier protein] reductase|nr:SDR family oxidoreductase [Dehalococcoidia bacterium]
MIDPQLAGKVALVTGANHGIGAETAVALAAQGVLVFVTYLSFENPAPGGDVTVGGEARYHAEQARNADEVVEQIRSGGGLASALECDLSEPANIAILFDRVESELGAVDILVNNATGWMSDSFLPSDFEPGNPEERWSVPTQLTVESHDLHFNMTSRGTVLMMTEFVNRFIARKARWGRVINISTDAARAFAREVSYGASKYAVESYSRSAAEELGPLGITVNIVSPGPIQTGYIPPGSEPTIVADTPLGRVGMPDDVADVIVFLASEQARWVTGQLIHVGGGHRM